MKLQALVSKVQLVQHALGLRVLCCITSRWRVLDLTHCLSSWRLQLLRAQLRDPAHFELSNLEKVSRALEAQSVARIELIAQFEHNCEALHDSSNELQSKVAALHDLGCHIFGRPQV